MMRMLDLFCGRWGWSREFAARGWECVGVDLTEPPEIPSGCTFVKVDVLRIRFHPAIGMFYLDSKNPSESELLGRFDFICASSPCENFSLFRMAHFHPKPPYPTVGLELFNHTRRLCEESGVLYVMENVAGAEDFLGRAQHRCGPFYLWGNAVPPLMPRNIKKGIKHAEGFRKDMTPEEKRACRLQDTMLRSGSKSKVRKQHTAAAATIPPELAKCVADYAEALLHQRS